ncbi:MAG: hypothetical protein ABEI77_04590 [Halorientalis sp.]
MSGDVSGSFRTKTGHCRLDGESIELTHDATGNLGNVYDGLVGGDGDAIRILATWAAFAVAIAIAGLGLWFVPWFAPAVAAISVAVIGVSYYRKYQYNFTDDDTIPLGTVRDVTFTSGIPGLTRPRFVVHYRENDTDKHRYVFLPSKLYAKTDDAICQGKRLFAANDLPVEE